MNALNSTAKEKSGPAITEHLGVKVTHTVSVCTTLDEAYRCWRRFENLPRFIRHLESVQAGEDGRSHWVARAPAGVKLEWDAELVNDKAPNLIAWKSRPGSDLRHAGTIRFKPAPPGRGIEVTLLWEYVPPAGKFGKSLAKLLGEDPEDEIRDVLRRFKAWLEAGEIPTTEGQPSARKS